MVALRAAIDASDERHRLEQLTAKLDDLDARVTAVSTELTNQLIELGSEMDALAEQRNGHDPDVGHEQVVGELRSGQVRLANEQARYQIAFRDDLALLAEEVRRPR